MTMLVAPLTATDSEIELDEQLYAKRLPYQIVIDEEALLVTGVSGNRCIVRRGLGGTDPVEHAAGAEVVRAYALFGTNANAGLSSGGAHPGLAAHESLGLAAAHDHPYADPEHDHGEYVHAHPYAADDHTHPGGDGEHPDAAAHELLGLAGEDHAHDTTHDHDATYSGTAHAHVEYATDDALATHASETHGTTAHAISGVQHTGTLDHSALGSVTANQHHNQTHALGGGDHSGSLAQASVTNLTADLAGKASTIHGHVIADTTNLQSSIDGKAAAGHNHDAAYSASGHTHTLVDGDIPAAIARDAEVTSAIATHAATPHGGESAEVYAVGDLYITTANHADGAAVATRHGYGTWARFGVGRFLLLTDGTAGQTGGSATHAHSFTQPDAHTGIIDHTHAATVTDPQHAHVQGVNSATTGGLSGYTPDTSSNTRVNSGYSTSNAATGITVANASPAGAVASLAHANGAVANGSTDPLSITAYAWQRTA